MKPLAPFQHLWKRKQQKHRVIIPAYGAADFFLKESGDSNSPAVREIDVLGGQEELITILLCWPPLSLLQ